MKSTIYVVVLLLAGVVIPGHAADEAAMTLLGRSRIDGPQVPLSSDDWTWLREKRTLVVGVAQPDFPPFEMTSSGVYYEGATADIEGLLGQMLRLFIHIKTYSDRHSALAALERGDIDILGSANSFEVAGGKTLLSHAYLKDQVALFIRNKDYREVPVQLDGMRISIAEDYLPVEEIYALYPKARLRLYPSRDLALAALAFGEVDLYLGDTISSNYLINLSYFNYVRLESLVDLQSGGFSFALKSNNFQLKRVLDAAIDKIDDVYLNEITKRWSGGGGTIATKTISLSPSEERWIKRNPVIHYSTYEGLAPLSFFDDDGHFSGVAADLLKLISQRTGLRFNVQQVESVSQLIDGFKGGETKLGLLTPKPERETRLRFSKPFLFGGISIIARDEPSAPNSLKALQGKRVAIPLGHTNREVLSTYPNIQIINTLTLMEALEMVANGNADATFAALEIARYYTLHLYNGQLRVTNIIEGADLDLAFATRRADSELISIIDKALLSIPPDEIDVILNRWRPYAAFSGLSWINYKVLIFQIAGAAFVFILFSLIWNWYIRRQIQQRQRAELALNDQLKFMGTLINGTPHPIYVRDNEGRMVTCNNNYLKVFSVTSDDVIGKTTLESGKHHRLEALQFHDDYLRVISEDQSYEVDRTLHVGEQKLSIYHWIQPYHETSGAVKGVICGWIDISERRELIEELRSAKDLADESSRAKTSFLAIMSHEIRTPMSAVIGMLELALKRAELGHFDRPAIEVAYDSAKGLLELIGDILDIARIESGHVSLAPRRANLRELVESVVRVFDGLARQKSLNMKLDIDANVGCDVLVDPMRFKQILSNLLGNAIKFTDTGEVRVLIRGQRVADERLHVELKVEDTGIGISASDRQRLFQPFSQANHGPISRGGTGLGLAISRSLCELMGGSLEISSTLGRGTCVEVDLFFSTLDPVGTKSSASQQKNTLPSSGLEVLVVDDQPANRLLLEQQLVFLGHNVSDAENGAIAFEKWSSTLFDVVITDCNMPVMNGYDLTRSIREQELHQESPRCLIIGFTANAQPEERTKCLAAGMDECLFKPISLSTLSNLLSSTQAEDEAADSPSLIESLSIEDRLLELTGGDLSTMKALLHEALLSCSRDLAELQELIPANEAAMLSHLSHRIKGAARIVDERAVILACDELEAVCHAPVIVSAEVTKKAADLEKVQAALVRKLQALFIDDLSAKN